MSKFIVFVIGKNFSKVANDYFLDKNVIKWKLLDGKNLTNQHEILFEYEDKK